MKNHKRSYYLCEELVEEIFERLPPKSLLKCRSLSKSWCSRISTPAFIRNQTIQSAMKAVQTVLATHRIHFNEDDCDLSYIADPKHVYITKELATFPSNDCYIVGSCFGIICVYKKKGGPSVTLWNPSIRRKLSVPHHLCLDRPSDVAFGFGFDPITDDYKIAAIYDGALSLYSMNSNCWTEIAIPATTTFSQARESAIFLYGALHWVVNCESNNTCHSYILTFNSTSHVFGMISLPKPTWVHHQLTIINECLAVISNDGYENWLWAWREYNNVESWSNPFKLTSNGFEGKDSVIQLKSYAEDSIAYNPFSGVYYSLQGVSDSSYIIRMDICSQSLQLLDRETC